MIEEKKPSSHAETVAVLAYVLSQDGRAEFSGEDIRRAYLRAGRRPPKAMEQALRDAKNRFDYLEITGERGKYRLSDYGESVVRFDLPRAAK